MAFAIDVSRECLDVQSRIDVSSLHSTQVEVEGNSASGA